MGVQLDQYGCLRNVEGGLAGIFLWTIYGYCKRGDWPESVTVWNQLNELVEMVEIANNTFSGMNERQQ